MCSRWMPLRRLGRPLGRQLWFTLSYCHLFFGLLSTSAFPLKAGFIFRNSKIFRNFCSFKRFCCCFNFDLYMLVNGNVKVLLYRNIFHIWEIGDKVSFTSLLRTFQYCSCNKKKKQHMYMCHVRSSEYTRKPCGLQNLWKIQKDFYLYWLNWSFLFSHKTSKFGYWSTGIV